MSGSRRSAAWLVVLSSVAFGLALVLPLFTIHPSAGKWTPLARLISPETFQATAVTLPGGMVELCQGGNLVDIGLAMVLGLCSLVLPMIKLAVLWWEIWEVVPLSDRMLSFFRVVSRYAMIEVFLIALLAMWIKGMPGGNGITLQAGTWCFTASVLLSLIASRTAQAEAASDTNLSSP